MTNQQPTDDNMDDNMRDRINNMFSSQELPSYASLKEVEAMKNRIHELEAKLALKTAGNEKTAQNTALENRADFLNQPVQESSTSRTSQQVRNASQMLMLFLGAIVISLPIYFYWAAQTGAWQIYAIMAVLVIAGISVWIGISLVRRGQVGRAMSLMIGSTFLVIPVIVALISGLGVVLAITQLLIVMAIVGQNFFGSRSIRFLISGLAFSIATFLIDLIAPWERLSVAGLQSSIPIIAFGLIGLLGFILARQFNLYSLRTKLVITFIAISLVSVGAVGIVTNRIITSQFNNTLGNSFNDIALRMARETGNSIIRSKIAMDGLALNKFIQDGVEGANLNGTSDVSVMTSLDKQWAAATENSPIIKQVLDNELSGELRELQERLPQYAELFLTDKYGAIIASTDRTSDYYQADEEWWQSAWNNNKGKVYISQSVFDESTGIYAIDIAIPIPAHNRSDFVGILRATININEVTNVLSANQFGETGQAVLVLPNNQFLSQEIGVDLGTLSSENIDGISSLHALYGQIEYDGVESLVSKAPVTIASGPEQEAIQNLNWTIVVHQDLVEAHQPITTTTRGILVTAIGVLIAAGMLALFVGGQFARPIEGLTVMAAEITKGNLSAKAAETSQDEIGILAGTFNRMAGQLRDTLVGLEQRVADRTHDLELASEVSRTVAAKVDNLNGLLNEAVDLIRARFNLYYTQVYIADFSGRIITLRAGTGEVGKQLLQRGHSLPINSGSLNGNAASEKRAVIVADTLQSESFLANPLLPNTRSEMAVPLMVGDRVVGVLDMQSEHPDALNETNLPAFEALAGQLAVAVENASLFEQVNRARADVEDQARRQSYADWSNFLNAVERSEKFGYIFNQNEVIPLVNHSDESRNGHALHAPLSVSGVEIGKIHIVDDPDRKWTTTEADIIHNTATQLSRHIENLRLLAQSEKYRLEAEQVSRRLTREGWESYLQVKETLSDGYIYSSNQVQSLEVNDSQNVQPSLSRPLIVHDEAIGELAVQANEILSQDELDILEAVSRQLSSHIENLRLSEQRESALIQTENVSRQNQLILGSTGEGIFGLDKKGNHTFVNPAAAELLGYELDELIGKHSHSIWHHSHLDGSHYPDEECPIYTCINEGIEHQGDEYFWKKDGTGIHVTFNATPIREGKNITGAVVSFLDITERKQAEVQLRTNEARLSEALNIARLGNWEYDVEKDIFTFNDAFYSIFRTNIQEVGSYQLSSSEYTERFVHPEDAPLVGVEIGKAMSSTERYFSAQLEHRIIFSDGSVGYIAVNIHVERDEEGKIMRWYGANQDVTERRIAQNIIAQRANQLETVATVSTTASTVLDPDELLKAVVNLTKERFNLYHAHVYLLDESWNTLLLAAGAGEIGYQLVTAGHAIQIDAERSLVARAARERQAVIANDVRNEADFLPNPFLPDTRSEMAIPMIVGDRVLGVLDVQSKDVDHFTQEDISIQTTLAAQVGIALQNARLYQEQSATVTQLRELDKLKSSFLANMSHELRTPLNSILGFADVMLEELDGPLTPNMDNDLKLIQKNGQHLLHLINDVLDMAKIESGKLNLIIEKFNLHEIMEEVTSITSSLANEKNLILSINDDSDRDLEVNADRTRLRQVMINLVNNAMKFTDKGKIAIHVTREGNSVLISVQDTGIGIEPSHLEAIFQEFTQVDSSTTRKAGGTGLGLPISRRLIEMHGGRLWAESTGVEGEGATFYVFLPIESQVASSEPVTRKI